MHPLKGLRPLPPSAEERKLLPSPEERDELSQRNPKRKTQTKPTPTINHQYYPKNVSVTKERDGSFRVTADFSLKVQVLNYSNKDISETDLSSFANDIQSRLYACLSKDGILIQNSPFDLIGNQIKQSNSLKSQKTIYVVKFNISAISIGKNKDKLESYTRVLAIVDAIGNLQSEDIVGKPNINVVGIADLDGRVATMVVGTGHYYAEKEKWLHIATHEILHTLGFMHKWNKVPGDKGAGVMNYGSYTEKELNQGEIGTAMSILIGPWHEVFKHSYLDKFRYKKTTADLLATFISNNKIDTK